MADQTIDYTALAKQAGAVSSQPTSIDYTALAKQAGAVSSQPTSSKPPTWMDQLSDIPKGFWNNMVQGGQGLVDAGKAVYNTVAHPIETAKGNTGITAALGGIGKSQDEVRLKAEDAFKKGNYAEGVRHVAGYMIPMLGPQLDASGDKAQAGHVGEAVGETLGMATQLAAPEIAGSAPVQAIKRVVVGGAKNVGTTVLGMSTGTGGTVMRQALDHPTGDLVNAMRGNTGESEVLEHFRGALQTVKDQRGAAYRQQLAQIPKDVQVDITPVRQSLDKKLGDFNIKRVPGQPATALPDGTPVPAVPDALDFSRSTVRDSTAQNEVKSIVNDVDGWGSKPDDLTPTGVDTLKRRIDDTYSPSSTARAIVQSVKDSTRTALNTQVPGYVDMTKGYADASRFIDSLGDLSLESKNPGTAIRKLTTALKQNNQYRDALTDALGQYTGVDLKGELAGISLNRAAPRGLVGPMSGAGLVALISKGMITPHYAVTLLAESPRLVGETMVAIGKLKQAGVGPSAMLPQAARVGQFLKRRDNSEDVAPDSTATQPPPVTPTAPPPSSVQPPMAASAPPPAAAASVNVGETRRLKGGKTVEITKVYPDGTFDYREK